MKKNVFSAVLALCLLLPGCSPGDAPDSGTQSVSSSVMEEDSAQSERLAESQSGPQPERPVVSNGPYMPPDYSDHDYPDEDNYSTMLADPARLMDGTPVIVTPEQATARTPNAGIAKKDDTWGYDLRDADLTGEDLNSVADLHELSFNTMTVWPDQLPEGFDPDKILEIGKNPGLGIRDLHEAGITGAGVGIAMIDKPLLTGHEQYADQLMYYEKIHCAGGGARMHGSNMASIAVGKDIGVAPDAKLYFIASDCAHYYGTTGVKDASVMADCILRVLEINRYLPDGEKIRVISFSMEYSGNDTGFWELIDAIERAKAENIFVVTASVGTNYDIALSGMRRALLDDPDDFDSYFPMKWSGDAYYKGNDTYMEKILVPGGTRTYAARHGAAEYEFIFDGSLSQSVAWFSGFYALCCQVKPDITPQEFIEIVKATAVTTEITHGGEIYPFGQIINPAGVVAELQKGAVS